MNEVLAADIPIEAILGITGNRGRITGYQYKQMRELIEDPAVLAIRHGDCKGADEISHGIALAAGKHIFIHPPLDKRYRAFCTGPPEQVTILKQRPYLWRNTDIVMESHRIAAFPGTAKEVLRSGSWTTIRRARANGRTEANGRLVIVTP